MKTQVFNPPNDDGQLLANVTISDLDGFEGAVIKVTLFVDNIDSRAAFEKNSIARAIEALRRAISDHDAECP